MSKPELTKLLISQTVKKLTSSKPIDKISIAEIADAAGINRKTFYYHFVDKQEMICWIFDYDTENLTDKNANNTILDDIVEYIYSEKSFYLGALTSEVQNNLGDHIYYVCYRRIIAHIKQLLNDERMDDGQIHIFANFFTLGVVGMLIQWAKTGMGEETLALAAKYMPLLNEALELVIGNLPKPRGIFGLD